MQKPLVGKHIKYRLRHIAADLVKDHGVMATYETSQRGVPYVRVYVNDERYHICFFGKHQYFRVFHANHPNNPHVDFPLEDEEAMFEYLIEMKGGYHGHEEGTFVSRNNPIYLVERKS